ncbi:MAG: kelch repeat-containing protein, partial [Phycisphaerae bacterium]|nr:kelch repeat-containing protein [Phycisphaerae bacterium]
MRIPVAIPILTTVASVALLAALAPAAEPATQPGDVKTVTVPDRKSPEPEPRGKPYPVPATKWEQRPVLWGWTCELADGSALAFGGVHQTADDGNPHTSIRDAGQWKPIIDELRKGNPLQKQFSQVRELRNACKDALAKARHIYFEGKTADEEAKLLRASVAPAVEKLTTDLARLREELKGRTSEGEYEAGQVAFALAHIDAATAQIKPFGPQVSPEQMATLRKAQIELEIAAEAFDAEPPPRALSRIAFDPKSNLFVIFGGEHMDYATNDLWVFDPAKRRWFQRHPASAPEPRFDHHFDALGDGRLAMRGGCTYEPGKGYIHVGPDRWLYEVAKNAWSADGHQQKAVPADTRSARYWPPAG